MAGTEKKEGAVVVEAVLRAIRLLECFERGQPEMSLAEFVQRGGYSKTTTYRLLRTLESAGWLERTSDAGFRLTIRPFQLGTILVDSLELRKEAGPMMSALAAKWKDTVYLIIPSNGRAVCVERVDGGSVRMLDLEVGGSIPFHLGGGPKALLAFREDELLPQLLEQGLTRRTGLTNTNQKALRKDLEEIRERGYALSIEDVTTGIGAVGAPVFDRSGQAVAAISLSGLVEHFQPGVVEALADDVREATSTLSTRLGYVGPA